MTRIAVLLLVAASASAAADEALDSAFDRDVLIIVAEHHACLRFDVYLATRREQQVRGLMHVRELPADTGMLFIYDGDEYRSMWMKNTFIPLDISFAKRDGTIVNIVRDTEPQSLASIRSAEPVRYVLELNAGVTKALGIEPGSRILWGAILEQ